MGRNLARRWLIGTGSVGAATIGALLQRRAVDRRRAEALADAHQATAARLDTLLARSPVAFAFLELDGTISQVNEAFAALFGYASGQLAGRRAAEALPDIWLRVAPLFDRVRATGQPIVDLEVSGRTRAEPGIDHYWLASLFPVPRDARRGGPPVGLGALVVDITERKRWERSIELLAAASNLFAADLTFSEALQQVARLALPSFADACLMFVPGAGGSPERAAIAHVDPAIEARLRELAVDLSHPARHGPAATAMRTGEIGFVEVVDEGFRRDIARDDGHVEFLEALAAVSTITVPLGLGGRVVGAVTLMYTATSNRAYREQDIDLAREFGRRIAQVLENVRLAQEAARAASRVQLLARVGELLTVELDADRRLQRIARLLLPEFADGTAVYLIDRDKLNLVAAGHSDPRVQEAIEASELPSHDLDAEIPPCEAVRTGRAVLVEDLPPGTARELIRGVNMRGVAAGNPDVRPLHSYLAVPLVGTNGPFGALGFGYRASGRRYEPDDVAIALELARRIAPALENAQRYEDDREVIEVLQRSLLPAVLPKVPGITIAGRYLPGAAGLAIGGDWYDALVLADGRVFLAIGDVVGHGVRAASSMGRLRNALEIYALDNESPAQILAHLNTHFSVLESADMATVGLLIYDPRRQRARLASAGHLPPVVREPDGRVHFLDPARGMPVCASPRATYTDTEVAIEPGSTLLLYTDGLIERRYEHLDEGFERLRAAVSDAPAGVEELAEHVIQRLSEARPPTDDVALLVVHFDPSRSDFSLHLTAAPRELAALRRTLIQWAERAGASAEQCDKLVLAVNEATANAVEHAYAPGEGRIDVTGRLSSLGVMEVVVRDFGRWRPSRPGTSGGRGLTLMQNLTDDLSIETAPSGTTVRMSLFVTPEAGT